MARCGCKISPSFKATQLYIVHVQSVLLGPSSSTVSLKIHFDLKWQIMSKSGQNIAHGTAAKIWLDLTIWNKIRVTIIFTKFQSWALKSYVIPLWSSMEHTSLKCVTLMIMDVPHMVQALWLKGCTEGVDECVRWTLFFRMWLVLPGFQQA